MKIKIAAILFLSTALFAKTINATYVAHIDGDTVVFKHNKKQLVCQLEGIDAPELHTSRKMIQDAKKAYINYGDLQNIGMESFVYMKETFIKGVEYRLDIKNTKNEKIKRCFVYIPGQQHSLNERAVFDGYAVVDKKSTISKHPYLKRRFIYMQQAARADQEGLWKEHYKTMHYLSGK